MTPECPAPAYGDAGGSLSVGMPPGTGRMHRRLMEDASDPAVNRLAFLLVRMML